MASFRIYKTRKLSDGSTFRESYSYSEYYFYKFIGWVFDLTIFLFFTIPTYIFLKIPYWIIRKVLYIIPNTKSLSVELSDSNKWINNLTLFKSIVSILFTPILWGLWVSVLSGVFQSKSTTVTKSDTLTSDTVKVIKHKKNHKKIKHYKSN
jgi:hypothetical protein